MGIPGYDPWATAGDCVFVESEAKFAIDFVEQHCRHVKGVLGGQRIKLEMWQKAVFANLWGWKRPDGTRRYREAMVYVPRGNGKTVFAACIVMLVMYTDDEPGAELYSSAAERDQARLCFEMVEGMIRDDVDLEKLATIFKRAITRGDVSYKALSCEAGSKHGFSPHLVVNDELHAHKSAELTEVLMTGTLKRTQPLVVHLTTADFERESICNQKHSYACSVRDGDINDPAFLPVIYEADIEDDWASPAVWEKANPNYNVSVFPDYLKREAERADSDPAYLNTFRRLHLNMKTSTSLSCIRMDLWDGCDERRPLDDLLGKECYAGLDIASKQDINALVLVFPDWPHIDVLSWFWVPEAAAETRGRDAANLGNYHGWSSEGLLNLVPGSRMDQDLIHEKLNELNGLYDIKQIAYDNWNAEKLRIELERDGFEMVEFRQSIANFTEPFKEWLAMIGSGQVRHGGNKVMRWMAQNLASYEDTSGNIRTDKGKSRDKIDGQVAGIMATGIAMLARDETSIYDTREPIVIGI